MIVRGVGMFSGLEEGPDSWALREVVNLCGLTLGGCVEEDLYGPPTGAQTGQSSSSSHGLRLVVSHGSLR